MKFLLILCILFTQACSNHKQNSSRYKKLESLEKNLSKQELKMHSCFKHLERDCNRQSNNKACFQESYKQCLDKNYKIKTQRIPASKEAMLRKEQLINSNNWFFFNPTLISSFVSFMGKLKSFRKEIINNTDLKEMFGDMIHGRGIGFYGGAYAVLGKRWLGEAVIHNKRLALFCAPSSSLVSDIGVEAGVSALSTLACRDHAHYSGSFISASIGISGEVFLIPLSAEMAYSFGVDLKAYNKELSKLKDQEDFSYLRLLAEIAILQDSLIRKKQNNLAFRVIKTFARLIHKEKIDKTQTYTSKSEISKLLKRKSSLGKIIKDFTSNKSVLKALESEKLMGLKGLFNILSKSLTGCDSIAGSVALSLSLSPVAIGASHSYYTELVNIGVNELKQLASIGTFALMNPFLLSGSTIALIAQHASKIKAFKSKMNQCKYADMIEMQYL